MKQLLYFCQIPSNDWLFIFGLEPLALPNGPSEMVTLVDEKLLYERPGFPSSLSRLADAIFWLLLDLIIFGAILAARWSTIR